jgi:hypothetical protein
LKAYCGGALFGIDVVYGSLGRVYDKKNPLTMLEHGVKMFQETEGAPCLVGTTSGIVTGAAINAATFCIPAIAAGIVDLGAYGVRKVKEKLEDRKQRQEDNKDITEWQKMVDDIVDFVERPKEVKKGIYEAQLESMKSFAKIAEKQKDERMLYRTNAAADYCRKKAAGITA